MKYKHFVITLFNLRLYTHDKSKALVDNIWLKGRFELFESYCLRSMQGQTSKNYIWLCLFDADTPDEFKLRLKKYQETLPQLHPVFIKQENVQTWREQVKDVIKSYLLPEDEYVITTNLDNDDSFHKSTIETLQQIINEKNSDGLYTFYTGLQYFVDKDLILKMTYPHNHFLTLCDKVNDGFKIIVEYPHPRARKMIKNVFDIENKLYWIEIVHKRNVNNNLRITSRIKYAPVFGTFSLKDYNLDVCFSLSRNIYNAFIKFPFLFLRTIPIKLIYKIRKQLQKEEKV